MEKLYTVSQVEALTPAEQKTYFDSLGLGEWSADSIRNWIEDQKTEEALKSRVISVFETATSGVDYINFTETEWFKLFRHLKEAEQTKWEQAGEKIKTDWDRLEASGEVDKTLEAKYAAMTNLNTAKTSTEGLMLGYVELMLKTERWSNVKAGNWLVLYKTNLNDSFVELREQLLNFEVFTKTVDENEIWYMTGMRRFYLRFLNTIPADGRKFVEDNFFDLKILD